MVQISPQLLEHSRSLREERALPFKLLGDPGNVTASKYGLTWTLPEDLRDVYRTFDISLPDYNGDDSWTLPIPARYVIDRDGIVRWASADPDYTVRPEPEETIAALRAL